MQKRILEPELMEEEAQVLAYSNADFTKSTQSFVQFIQQENLSSLRSMVDLGCGPADVDIALAKAFPQASILAIDGSAAMIRTAREKVASAKLSDRIELLRGRLPNLPVQNRHFDVLLSKDLLHHIPDPANFWREVERLATKSTSIFVMDLIRPHSKVDARNVVESVAGKEPEILKTDFYNSLLAAFTLEEIRHQLQKSRLEFRIKTLGGRHFVLSAKLK